MERIFGRIVGLLLKIIMEDLPQRVEDLLWSKITEDLAGKEGRPATGDRRGDRSAIY